MVLLSTLSLTFLATLAYSSPTPHTHLRRAVLPVRKSGGSVTAKQIVEHDIARITHFNEGASTPARRTVKSGKISNIDVSYVADVEICGETFSLVVDTGSSNAWVGAGKPFKKCAGSTPTGQTVSVSYGSGKFSGKEYMGAVTFAGLTSTKQSFGVASTATGFNGVDGILGIGPVDLTRNTVSHTYEVATFPDNLHSEGKISSEVIGVYFAAEHGSDTGDANGELTFGGTDSTKYSGSISYFPKTTVGLYSEYWGISGISFAYGSKTLRTGASGIVDTGTTLILIPTLVYEEFAVLSGGKTDSSSGLLSFKTKPTQNFTFKIAGSSFSLTPAQYLVPAAQYAHFGLESGMYYSWISNGGSGEVSTIIGQKFLENYYSVFDTTSKRIGFAAHKA